MRVWIVSRQGLEEWDDIEGVFLQRESAHEYMRKLMSESPQEEFGIESLTVIE